LRETDSVIDQLHQLRAERKQHSVKLAELRYQLPKRDREKAFAEAPSASTNAALITITASRAATRFNRASRANPKL
jgi:hypothetical protein